jgi:hypothetical protein
MAKAGDYPASGRVPGAGEEGEGVIAGLLRQPGGFEGLALVEEPAQAGSPAVSHLDDPSPSVIDLDPAPATATAHISEDQNAVAQIAKLRGFKSEGFPTLGHVAEKTHGCLWSRSDASQVLA